MEPQPMTKQERKRLYDKKYREVNRELILAKQAEYRKLTRRYSCGEIVSRNHYSHHIKTKKHLRLLQEQVVKPDGIFYVDTIAELKEEAIQQETVEEPLLAITEEEITILHRLLTLLRR